MLSVRDTSHFAHFPTISSPDSSSYPVDIQDSSQHSPLPSEHIAPHAFSPRLPALTSFPVEVSRSSKHVRLFCSQTSSHRLHWQPTETPHPLLPSSRATNHTTRLGSTVVLKERATPRWRHHISPEPHGSQPIYETENPHHGYTAPPDHNRNLVLRSYLS